MAGGLREPSSGLGVTGDVAGGRGCHPRYDDFLTGGLFRDRYVWLREELCFRQKGTACARTWGVKLDRSLGYEGWQCPVLGPCALV